MSEKEKRGSGKGKEGGMEGERRERDNDEIGIECRSYWAEEGEGRA